MPDRRRPDRVDASLIRKIFDRATKQKASGGLAADLSIGQLHLPADPRLLAAAGEALRAGRNGYQPSGGDPHLVDAVLEHVRERRGYAPDAAIVTAGVSGGLTLALLALAEPGDDVLLPDPYFVSYPQLTEIAGARPVYYDTYPDFRLRAEAVEAALTDRTRVIVVNSPANPTGAAHGEQELRAVAEIAAAHGIPVLSDEIYDTLNFDRPHVSIARFHDRTVTLSGWGKSLSITGWRIGYATGPAHLIADMVKMQQFTFVCVSGAAQSAVLACRDLWESRAPADACRANRERICAALKGRYAFTRPGGAFYVFLEVPGGGAAFCERAIERGLLVIPGGGFSRRDTHVRVSFAVDEKTLERGIEILLDLAGDPERSSG